MKYHAPSYAVREAHYMSEDLGIVVTDALGVPKESYEVPETDNTPFTFEDPRIEAAVPQPTGYQILVVPVEPKKESDGGIIKPFSAIDDERISSVVGQVIRMGPDCYQDEKRFPNGPYCSIGDWVIFHAYSGTRIKVASQEFRLINDDTVKAVVKDPRLVVRA